METNRLEINGKIDRPLVFVLALLFHSCALLDGYTSNQHAAYHQVLTDAQKAEIVQNGSVELLYSSKSVNRLEKGTLLVRKDRNRYNFVERGAWIEKRFDGLDTTEFIVDRKIHYDQYGNIRKKKTYANHARHGTYLSDVWTSELKIVDGDSVLIQHIDNYYTNGQVAIKLSVAVPNYREVRSDYLKTKYRVGEEYKYDMDGNLTDSTKYNLSDRIVRKGYF